MTALAGRIELRAVRGVRPVSVAIAGGTALWVALVAGVLAGAIALPAARVLLFGVPLALAAAAVFARPAPSRALAVSSVVSLVVLAAVLASTVLPAQPAIALVVPVLAVATVVCARYPAAAVVGVFALTGFFNTLAIYTPVPAGPGTELLLAALWGAVVWRYLFSRRDASVVLWPGVVLSLLYVVLSLAAILAAEQLFAGIYAFRIGAWYMLAFVLVAYGGWSAETYGRILRGTVIAALAVGGYASLRWIIGPAGPEVEAAVAANPFSNFVNGELRLFGSFPTGHDLAAWTAPAVPFLFGAALALHGPWRVAAAAGALACALAVLGTEVRIGGFAALAGIGVAVLLYQFARAFRGLHLGATLAVAFALAATGAALFTLTAGADESSLARYESALNYKEDLSYKARVFKWETALADIDDHPLGQGLGTAGKARQRYGRFVNIGSSNVDNGYLKVALDQGFAVMVLFGAALLVLLAGLARRAVVTGSGRSAGVALGAAGALTAFGVLLVAGIYQEGPTALATWIMVGLGVAQFSSRSD